MKILGLSAHKFLIAHVNSKLIEYAKRMEFSPEHIFCLNMLGSLDNLKKLFPLAHIKQLEISDLVDNNFSVATGLDLFLVNFAIKKPDNLEQVLQNIKNLMKKSDILIFASLDHLAIKNLFASYRDGMVDELQIIESLHAFDDIFVMSFRERLLNDYYSSGYLDTHIFVISQKKFPSFELTKESENVDHQNESEIKNIPERDILGAHREKMSDSDREISEINLDADEQNQLALSETSIPEELNDGANIDMMDETVESENVVEANPEVISTETGSDDELMINEKEGIDANELEVDSDASNYETVEKKNDDADNQVEFQNEIEIDVTTESEDEQENESEQESEGEVEDEDEQDSEDEVEDEQENEDGQEGENEEEIEDEQESERELVTEDEQASDVDKDDDEEDNEGGSDNADQEYDALDERDTDIKKDSENEDENKNSDTASAITEDTTKPQPIVSLQFNLLRTQKLQDVEFKDVLENKKNVIKEKLLKK